MSAEPEREKVEGSLAFVTTRPVAITMLMVAISVFGLVSFGKLPVDLLPDISYPTLTVRTTYEGAAPEDIEDRISERVQEALSTLPRLVRSTSISRAETSDVVLDFDWGTEMSFAVQDVRDKLDSVFLPQGAERPLILRYDPNLDPILRIGVKSTGRGDVAQDDGSTTTHDRELVQLRWVAENKIQRELESIPGVAAVQVRGGLEEEIRVRVDPFKMATQELDPNALAMRLAQENINASGGLIREGSTEYLVRTLNEFQTVDEIEDLAVERRGDATIRVRDIASVERTHAERDVIATIGGKEAVEIAIYREAGANIVQLAESVKTVLFGTPEQQAFTKGLKERGAGTTTTWEERSKSDYMAWRLRNEAELELLSDQSTFIRSAVDEVKDAAVVGSILSILVIWLFLRGLAGTTIISLSIPISVIATFALMYMLDVSLNIMSLGGLALGVGMVVDNAIVVLESIARCRSDGDSLAQAAVRGTREVAGAVTASTLTTVAVFAPIVFVHGLAGQLFGDQALTVVTSMLVSLLVAILFIPTLASRTWIMGGWKEAAPPTKPRPVREGLDFSLAHFVPSLCLLVGRLALAGFGLLTRLGAFLAALVYKTCALIVAPLRAVFDFFWIGFERGYARLLTASLRASWLIVFLSIAMFAWAIARVPALGVELLPEIRQGEFTFHVALGVGSPLQNTEQVLDGIERQIRALDGVQMTALTVGVEKDTLTRDVEGQHTARLTVRLTPEAANFEREEAVVAEARRIIGSNPEVRSIDLRRPTPFALDAPITVEVLGHDLKKLEEVGAQVVERMSRIEALTDIRSSVRPGHPEARVTFDRDKTLEYGLDLDTVSNFVRDQVLGNVSTRFVEGDERIDVRVLGDEQLLASLADVLGLVVNPTAPTPVELGSVARVVREQGPAEIRRIGNSRAVVITAAGTGLDLGGLSRSIEDSLRTLTYPDDVIVQLGGQKAEMDDAQSSMRFALLLALFLVYVVMACQFESLVQPLVILVTVPLALVGVVFTLDVLELSVSVTVFIGMIMLAGIVVNNAIVLLDRINQRRAGGEELRAAIEEAGSTRLRPIMMTAVTTVTGLLPLTGWMEGIPLLGTMGSSQGAEVRAPMAITVIAGLTSSTFLTLIVIPVIYYLVERRSRRRAEEVLA